MLRSTDAERLGPLPAPLRAQPGRLLQRGGHPLAQRAQQTRASSSAAALRVTRLIIRWTRYRSTIAPSR